MLNYLEIQKKYENGEVESKVLRQELSEKDKEIELLRAQVEQLQLVNRKQQQHIEQMEQQQKQSFEQLDAIRIFKQRMTYLKQLEQHFEEKKEREERENQENTEEENNNNSSNIQALEENNNSNSTNSTSTNNISKSNSSNNINNNSISLFNDKKMFSLASPLTSPRPSPQKEQSKNLPSRMTFPNIILKSSSKQSIPSSSLPVDIPKPNSLQSISKTDEPGIAYLSVFVSF